MPFLIWSLVVIIKSTIAIEITPDITITTTSSIPPEVFTWLPQPTEERLKQFLNGNLNNSDIDQEFKDRLYQAALDVATLHRKSRSFEPAIPPYTGQLPRLPLSDPQITHAYTIGSGVSNREDTFITTVREEPLYENLIGVSGWRYVRYNHNDYLLAILHRHLVIWKSNLNGKIAFDLRVQSAFAVVNIEPGKLIDCVFYVSRRDKTENLRLVAATYRETHSIFHIYAITHNKITPVTYFKLEDPVAKISYSALEGKDTLLVLRAAPFSQDASVVTEDKDGIEITKLWVSYPVDMVLLIYNGHRYVVVANDTVCDIFVSRDNSNFSFFDRLYLQGIVDLETFKIGHDVYLILVGSYQQIIFQVNENGLIPKQQLSLATVTEMSVFYSSSCRDDVALLVLTENIHEPTLLFNWRSISRNFEAVPQGILPESLRPDAGSVVSFFYNQTAYLVTISRDTRQSHIFSVKGETRSLPNPTLVKSNVMSDVMEDLESKLQKYEKEAQYYRHILNQAVRANQRVSVNHVLSSLLVELPQSVVKAGHLTENGVQFRSRDPSVTSAEFTQGLFELQSLLQALENELDNLERQLEDVVMRDSPAVITGHKTIHGLVSSPLLKFITLDMPLVGALDVNKALDNTLRLNREPTGLGNIIVKGNLRVLGNLDTSSFNGINLLHDVLLTSVPQVYKGIATFSSPLRVHGNMIIGDDHLGGVDLSQVIPLTDEVVFGSPLHFTSSLHVQRYLTTPVIDGVDVKPFIENTLRIALEQTLEIVPTAFFPALVSKLLVTGLVNGVDLNALGRNLVRANLPTRLNHLTLRNAVFDGGLFVKGRYDDLLFPDSLFIQGSSDPTISASKSFSRVTFRDLVYVQGLCDGLKLPEDVVTLSKDESLAFPLNFQNGMGVENDLSVSGLVDGVNLIDLVNKASKLTVESAKGVNAVFFGPVIVERHFVVSSPSEVDLEAIRNDLIFPDDRSIEITGAKSLSHLIAPAVDLKGMLNGFNVHEDFLHLRKDQVLTGKKVFKDPIQFSRNLGTGKNMVDGVNIVELYHNRVNLLRNSTMPGSLTCYDTVSVDHLLMEMGTLDGLKFPSDFVIKDSVDEQIIVGKRFLNGLKAREILLDGDLIVSDTLDGVPINDFLHKRVTLSTSQALYSSFSLGLANQVDQLDSVFINGKDASSFATDYVSLTSPQTIFGDVFIWFGDTNVLGDITTNNGINGYKFDDLKNRVMKLTPFQDLSYALTFPDGLSVQGNLEALKFNGLDFDALFREAFKKSTGGNLLGVNRFLSHVYIQGNLDAGLVNGMLLRDSLFLKTGDQNVLGSYTFGKLDVSGNFNPLGLVNGLNVSVLDRSLLKRDRNNVVNGNLHFGPILTVSGDIDVGGLINGVDLQALLDEAVWHKGMGIEQFVEGAKTISGPVTVDGQLLVGLVNGLELSAALADMAFVNRDSDIFGPKIFAGTVSVPKGIVTVPGNFKVGGLVSGVKLIDLTDHSVFVDQPVAIQGLTVFEQSSIFDGTIVIRGKINGVDWPEDLILLYTDELQTISGVKEFDQLSVVSHLNVDGLVNHQYHLPSLFLDTFAVYGDQTITGHKNMEGMVIFEDDVYGHVNNMNLVDEIVHLDRPENVVFNGRILFDGALVVQGGLSTSGRVCQVDLADLASHVVYTDNDQVIEGDLLFRDVTVHDVIVGGHLAGLDFRSFHDDVLKLRNEADQATYQLVRHNRDIDRAVNYLDNVASRSGAFLDHVHHYQGLNFSGYPVESAPDHFRLVHSGNETTVTTYVLDVNGRFVAETVEKSLMLLITTVQIGSRAFSLWSDMKGNGILSEGPLYLANYSGFVHGDVKALTDEILLIAILRRNTCHLIEMMVNPSGPGLVETPAVVIENLKDPVSVHVLKTATKIYVAIDVSAVTNIRDTCVRDPNSALLIYIWDLASKSAIFFQRLETASKHLATFEKNGFHYLAKTDANSGNRNPKTEIKFYRRDDRFKRNFEYSYAVSVPNVAAFEYFEMEDGYQYLGVVNGTHLTLGHLAESHGGFAGHSVIPCRHAYSVRRVLASDGNAYLVVGQGHTLAKNKGMVNLYRLSWTGSRLLDTPGH